METGVIAIERDLLTAPSSDPTISITEALDLTTASGRAMAALLAVFAEFEREILCERVKAGIAQAKLEGRPHGRPNTVSKHRAQVKQLYKAGVSKSEIARKLDISRTSVRRLLIAS
jgi:putative DNA-invertase from lambdoid prophage Rac